MQKVNTQIILDKRFQKKDGTYSVKLRITYNREQKYYPINISLREEEWDRIHSRRPRAKDKEMQLLFAQYEQKAHSTANEMDYFDLSTFEKNFNKTPKKAKDVFSYFDSYVEKLRHEQRLGTAESYECAKNSILKYANLKKENVLSFTDLSPEWLQGYENWMQENGKSITTTGIYLRSLRAIFNLAIEDSVIAKEMYPFGKRKYIIPAGQNIKKALKISDVKKIIDFQTNSIPEEKAKDMWILSYLCNGANMKDLALLQWKDIDNIRLSFIRAKTARTTKRNIKPVVVMLMSKIEDIINKWSITSTNSNDFIFSIVETKDDAITQRKKIKQFTQTTNKYMKKIGEALGFELKLTTYSARHTFATVMKRSGASTEFISESLGHKDLRTTENYLDSFEDDTKQKFQHFLLEFKE